MTRSNFSPNATPPGMRAPHHTLLLCTTTTTTYHHRRPLHPATTTITIRAANHSRTHVYRMRANTSASTRSILGAPIPPPHTLHLIGGIQSSSHHCIIRVLGILWPDAAVAIRIERREPEPQGGGGRAVLRIARKPVCAMCGAVRTPRCLQAWVGASGRLRSAVQGRSGPAGVAHEPAVHGVHTFMHVLVHICTRLHLARLAAPAALMVVAPAAPAVGPQSATPKQCCTSAPHKIVLCEEARVARGAAPAAQSSRQHLGRVRGEHIIGGHLQRSAERATMYACVYVWCSAAGT